MPAPEMEEVSAAIAALNMVIGLGQLRAWPVRIDGVRCIVLGRTEEQSDGLFRGQPLMVISNDELAAAMDLTEART